MEKIMKNIDEAIKNGIKRAEKKELWELVDDSLVFVQGTLWTYNKDIGSLVRKYLEGGE
jgi:hypothetical protein